VRILFVNCIVTMFLLLSALAVVGQERELTVVVVDVNGANISTAAVRLAGVSCLASMNEYICPRSTEATQRLEITANGFADYSRMVTGIELSDGRILAELKVADVTGDPIFINITRTSTELGQTPESVAVLEREAIASSAAPTLDDVLRQVPGFSIFRRSSSRNANPTTQGVSLRGVGASGASRSTVMYDGVPINDPFGGWVQWNRVSPISVESVEVLRGGASSLYGGSSLSGAIELRPRRVAEDFSASGELFGGSQRTFGTSGFAGGKVKGWSLGSDAGHLQTRGIIPVDGEVRGAVDTFAGVRSTNLSGRAARELGKNASIFLRPSYFDEYRTNGTPLQTNQTLSRQLIAGGQIDSKVNFEWRAFAGTQLYDQAFTAISADRISESLTRLQLSPSQNVGFSANVTTSIAKQSLAGGVEGREVRGASDETGFANGIATTLFGSGGRERSVGVYAKDVFAVGERIILSGGLRFDRWSNIRGASVTRSLVSGVTNAVIFPDRDESAFSPHAAVRFQLNTRVAFHTAFSHSFRAPTLNELYRGFRVGNVLTNANADLLAERAYNFEGGASFQLSNFSVRASAYRTDINRAIANVTLTTTPTLITRQRQNAGRTRTSGFELDVEMNIAELKLNAGYLFADSRVSEFPTNAVLINRFIPQVPRHQATFQARFPFREWIFSAQARASGEQFDDDLNQFRLEPYFQLDLFISKRFAEKLLMFAAVEDLFNSRYSVGRTPVRTVSSGINARVGFRWN
jgi:outer membrane receptor protein involved in Fe transport